MTLICPLSCIHRPFLELKPHLPRPAGAAYVSERVWPDHDGMLARWMRQTTRCCNVCLPMQRLERMETKVKAMTAELKELNKPASESSHAAVGSRQL